MATIYYFAQPDERATIREKGIRYKPGEPISLSNIHSAPVWQMLKGIDEAVPVDVTKLDRSALTLEFKDGYSKYHYAKSIPTEACGETVTLPAPDNAAKRTAWKAVLRALNTLCEAFARYYVLLSRSDTDYSKTIGVELNRDIEQALPVLSRMDPAIIHIDTVALLKTMSMDGECTLIDWYEGEPYWLYEMLRRYPEDELSANRKKLYAWIERNLAMYVKMPTETWRYDAYKSQI